MLILLSALKISRMYAVDEADDENEEPAVEDEDESEKEDVTPESDAEKEDEETAEILEALADNKDSEEKVRRNLRLSDDICLPLFMAGQSKFIAFC